MRIAVLPGDGIGVEVTAQAVRVLRAAVGNTAHLELTEAPIGAAGIAAAGEPLPATTLEIARKADAILFGAAGGPGEESLPFAERPGSGLLRLRKELTLFANFRPAFMFPELIGASTLKPEIVEGLDLIILRELNGDAYYGGRAASSPPPPASARGSTRSGTRSRRSSASRTSPSVPRAHGAGRSARSTRPMCWSLAIVARGDDSRRRPDTRMSR